MMVTQEDKQLVSERLKIWLDTLPPSQRNMPFFHALGVSLTPEQMLQEVQGESQLGEIIVKDQMKLIKKHQFL